MDGDLSRFRPHWSERRNHEWSPNDWERFQAEPRENINRELLITTWKWVASEAAKMEEGLPSEWHQGVWFDQGIGEERGCGTACCVAGRIALWDGRPAVAGDYTDGVYGPNWVSSSMVVVIDGQKHSVDTYAANVLGLTRLQAHILFDGENNLEDMRRLMSYLLDVENIEEIA
jgi:hypothetical protein